MSNIFIITGGVLTLFMAVFHLVLPVIFKWESDFEKIGTPKGKIHYTINLGLLLLFWGIGFLSIIFAGELAHPGGISAGLLAMIIVFWLWRMLWEIFYFKLSKGPKPKGPVLTHYTLIIISAILTIVYAYPFLKIK